MRLLEEIVGAGLAWPAAAAAAAVSVGRWATGPFCTYGTGCWACCERISRTLRWLLDRSLHKTVYLHSVNFGSQPLTFMLRVLYCLLTICFLAECTICEGMGSFLSCLLFGPGCVG